MLIVMRPGLGDLHPRILLVVIATLLFSFRKILSRYLSKIDSTFTTVSYTALIGSFWLTFVVPFVWVWPSSKNEIVFIFGITVFADIAEILVVKSLEIEAAVILSPVHYSLLVWGVFYGYFVFWQIPDFWT